MVQGWAFFTMISNPKLDTQATLRPVFFPNKYPARKIVNDIVSTLGIKIIAVEVVIATAEKKATKVVS